jgi:hypothetical protein
MPHGHPTPRQCQLRRPGPPQPPENQNSQNKAKFPHRESGPLAAPHLVDKTNPNSSNPYAITHLRSEPGRFAKRSNKIAAKLLEGDPEDNATRQSRSRRQSWERETESRATELCFPLPRNNLRPLCHPDSARPCSTGANRMPYGHPTPRQRQPRRPGQPRPPQSKIRKTKPIPPGDPAAKHPAHQAPRAPPPLLYETNPIPHNPLCPHPLTRAPAFPSTLSAPGASSSM